MARFDNGWIKLHRSVVEEDIGQRDNFTLGLFVRILRMANWRQSSTPVGGQRVVLQPGQLATGLRELSPDRDEDPYLHRVRNALEYLVKRGTITQATSNQGRIITIQNWEEYQSQKIVESIVLASEAQANRKQSASEAQHIEEVRKKKEESKPVKKRPSSPGGSSELWEFFESQLVKKRGIKAIHEGGKTGTQLKAFLSSFPELENAKRVIQFFIDDESDFVRDSGWSFGILLTRRQTYGAKLQKSVPQDAFTFTDSTEVRHG